jgi:hypothetical protein
MKFRQIYQRVVFCLMFWSCLATQSAFAQQNPNPASSFPSASATVADYKGGVQVRLPGQDFSTPSLNQVLPPDSEINTGNGQILLQLEDGSMVTVYGHTHLVLRQPATSNWQRLQLLLGRIKAEIQKRVSGAPPFQIGTPSAVIAVRGTRFYVEVDKHKMTEVDVDEGVVQLENAHGIGTPVVIQTGSSSRVGENSAPERTQPTQQMQQHQKKTEDMSDNNGNGPSSARQPMNPPHVPPPSKGNNTHK